MPRVIESTQTVVKVVPRDGELEITLNINVTVDGKVNVEQETGVIKDKSTEFLIPQFQPGQKIVNFSKETK